MGCARRSDSADQPEALSFDRGIELKDRQNLTDVIEDVEARSLLEDRKSGHYGSAGDKELRQALDHVSASHDRQDEVVK